MTVPIRKAQRYEPRHGLYRKVHDILLASKAPRSRGGPREVPCDAVAAGNRRVLMG